MSWAKVLDFDIDFAHYSSNFVLQKFKIIESVNDGETEDYFFIGKYPDSNILPQLNSNYHERNIWLDISWQLTQQQDKQALNQLSLI